MKKEINLSKKILVSFLLILVSVYFSGCSIEKASNEEEDIMVDEIEREESKTEVDTDADGLLDIEEQELGTSIYKLDSDNDGLTDFEEVKDWGTDPMEADTDGDGYKDGEEVSAGYDPLSSGQLDTDGDGVGDADEIKAGTDPKVYND